MSLSDIMSIAQSALQVSQAQVQATSNNVSNINTAGYSREVVNAQEMVAGGQGVGVTSDGIQRAANQFLQQATLTATAQSGQASTIATALNQAQSLFGDPSSSTSSSSASTSFFSSLDNVYSAFSTASDTPSDSLLRSGAVTSVSTFLQNASDLSASLSQMQGATVSQINGDMTTVNSTLQQISQLNDTIAQTSLSGGNASGAQDQQSQLLNTLAGLINIQTTPNATGGVNVRSIDGALLAGDQGAATVSYSTSGGAGTLTATSASGASQAFQAGGGSVGGLIQLNQQTLPQISAEVGQYVSQAVTQLNQASNASTAVPAPATLTGQAMGMSLSTAVGGFTGTTNIAILNSAGVAQQQVAVNFSAGTMTATGGSPVSFTPATFLTTLNSALAPYGSASFTNGALSISAASGGVAIGDDPTTPSSKAGQGFSQYFGLNDLVTSNAHTNFNTGLASTDPNTFSGSITLQLANAAGTPIRQAAVTMPVGGTIGDVISALNASVGAYGSFSLNSNGALTFAAKGSAAVTLSVAADSTVNSAGGPSLSQMFGIGSGALAGLTSTYAVRSDIAQNPNTIPFAALNVSAAAGAPAIASGDGSGALAMAQSGQTAIAIAAAGVLSAGAMSVSNYGAQIAGSIASQASTASAQSQTATATATAAASQLSSATGVNLDTELINLTTYQTAYSASSRLLQAVQTMYTSLLQMVQ